MNIMLEVLVVSDNASLVHFFQKEFVTQNLNAIAKIAYRFTASNRNPAGLVALGASPIDLKNCATVLELIDCYDLIFSLHCKQIFPPELVRSVRCVNIHPGLNPYNRGWYPQVFSLINSKPIGATIHIMDSNIDHGGIIDQVAIESQANDTSLTLYSRVINAEKQLLQKNLNRIILNDYVASPPPFEGNYNSIDDFRSICKLNLEKLGTLREHINLLRALSHGSFRNAYFFDDQGNKVFVSIALEIEDAR